MPHEQPWLDKQTKEFVNMQNCKDCKFLKDIQLVQENRNGITSVASCTLFNVQIINLHVDTCTGKISTNKD